MSSILRPLSAACLQMAMVTPIITTDDGELHVYLPLVERHSGFVPDYDHYAIIGTGLAAILITTTEGLLPYNYIPYLQLVATIAMSACSAIVAKDYGDTKPGIALWLCWAAILLSNWATASKKSSRRP